MFRTAAILLIMVLYGTELDIFIPSFPDLQHEFNLTPFLVQLTLSVNFIAYCICCLFAGSLGDRFNRRHVLLAGLGIFIAGSILCVSSVNFSMLLLGRLLQGIGIASPAILSWVILISDYPPAKQTALMGLFNGAQSLAVAIAPVVGSFINLYFNWRVNFFILLVMGIITFGLCYFAIESKPGNPAEKINLKSYLPLLRSPKLLSFVFSWCFIVAAYYIFVGMAPILYMESLGVSLKYFGFYLGSLSVVYSGFNLLSPLLLKWFGLKLSFRVSIWLCWISAIATLWIALSKTETAFSMTLILIVFSIGAVIPLNYLYVKTLKTIESVKSKASALTQSLRLALTALGLEIVSYCYQGNFMSTGIAIFICLFVSCILIQYQMSKQWLTFKEVE